MVSANHRSPRRETAGRRYGIHELDSTGMTLYPVTCRMTIDTEHGHRHVDRVGTDTDMGGTKLWTVAAVANALARGDRFYVESPATGATAMVSNYYCTPCRTMTLRSAPDAVADNNVENLPPCEGT